MRVERGMVSVRERAHLRVPTLYLLVYLQVVLVSEVMFVHSLNELYSPVCVFERVCWCVC